MPPLNGEPIARAGHVSLSNLHLPRSRFLRGFSPPLLSSHVFGAIPIHVLASGTHMDRQHVRLSLSLFHPALILRAAVAKNQGGAVKT